MLNLLRSVPRENANGGCWVGGGKGGKKGSEMLAYIVIVAGVFLYNRCFEETYPVTTQKARTRVNAIAAKTPQTRPMRRVVCVANFEALHFISSVHGQQTTP